MGRDPYACVGFAVVCGGSIYLLFLGFPIVALRTLEYTNIVVTQFELRFQ
jgi:hypothetical protein